jgi:ABC-type uncharacterized transport system substrate-binding protein
MYLFNPETIAPRLVTAVEAAAPLLSIDAISVPVSKVSGIESTIGAFTAARNGAVLVLPDIFLTSHRHLIIGLRCSAALRLPALYPFKFFPRDGGLISYDVEAFDAFRQAASYVDRILLGAGRSSSAGPTKFELVINLKTAKALGLTVPDKLLALADKVIE